MSPTEESIKAALRGDEANDVIAALLYFFRADHLHQRGEPLPENELALLNFFTEHLFSESTTALGGDLSLPRLVAGCLRLHSAHSAQDEEAADTIPPRSTTDVREILLFLTQMTSELDMEDLSRHHVTALARIFQRVYRQLVVDSVHRKCAGEASRAAAAGRRHTELVREVAASLRAWARDVILVVVNDIAPRLLCRDAAPQTVNASVNQTGGPSHGLGERQSNDEAVAGTMSWAVAERSSLVQSLFLTLRDIQNSAPPSVACQLGAAAVWAAAVGSQPFSPTSLLPLRSVPSARAHNGGWVMACSVGEKDGIAAAEAVAAGQGTPSREDITSWNAHVTVVLTSHHVMGAAGVLPKSTVQVLMDLLHTSTQALSRTAKDTEAHEQQREGPFSLCGSEEYLYEDWEQGRPKDYQKDLAIRQQRDAVLGSLTVWRGALEPGPSEHLSPHNTGEDIGLFPSTLRLAVSGITLLLLPHLLGSDEAPFVLSNTPASFFSCVVEALSVTLAAPSATLIYTGLTWTAAFVDAIPRYSLLFAEDLLSSNNETVIPTTTAAQEQGDIAHTRLYAHFFALARQLITLSATCPIEAHRAASRRLVEGLLQLLDERSRIPLQCVLAKLSPFPSVARSLIDGLQHQWREHETRYASMARHGDRDACHPFIYAFPAQLASMAQTFIAHITRGDPSFLDPFIAVLNFFRAFAAADIRRPVRYLSFDSQMHVRHSRAPAEASPPLRPGNRWPQAFDAIQDGVLPACKKLLSSSRGEEEHGAPGLGFVVPALSPLDEFSLSSSVQALEQLFAG